ncbi:MAG: transporter substrate-binding domain-containing protein, partial [Gammaproteobacteria bacterium]|nr:transporter substrate-binding domain-containing protein [Gammaproteobacteria bacterium]
MTTIITVVLWLIGTTYLVVKYLEIGPISNNLAQTQMDVVTLRAQLAALEKELAESQAAYQGALRVLDQPFLISPKDRSLRIGNSLTFVWDYRDHDNNTSYVLEVEEASRGENHITTKNVIRPELKRTHYTIQDTETSMIAWRVAPGRVVADQVITTGPWSPSGRVTVHPSVLTRIRETGKIRVGTTATSYGPFTKSDGQGHYHGFDIDLITWMAPRIGQRLSMTDEPSIQIVDLQWKDMFDAIQAGHIDIAIRAITRTKERESSYSKVRFSQGYLQNNQVIIQRIGETNFPYALSGAQVAVKQGSTNERAARALARQFGFVVDPSYVNYGDVYRALDDGDVQFGLVDYP